MSLEAARAAVGRDLDDPARETVLDACVEERRWWLEAWPDGDPYLLCLLAQDVQEAMHPLDPTWPLCPEHADHALVVEPDLGTDPFWVCERTGLPVAPVGFLH